MTIPETIIEFEHDGAYFEVGCPDLLFDEEPPSDGVLGFKIAANWDALLFSLNLAEVKSLRDALTKWIEEQETKR